jgi:hypothetical protein
MQIGILLCVAEVAEHGCDIDYSLLAALLQERDQRYREEDQA